jgi:hypothetical protein
VYWPFYTLSFECSDLLVAVPWNSSRPRLGNRAAGDRQCPRAPASFDGADWKEFPVGLSESPLGSKRQEQTLHDVKRWVSHTLTIAGGKDWLQEEIVSDFSRWTDRNWNLLTSPN